MPREISKYEFKICEAVALGYGYYYMGPKDKRKITPEEREKALYLINTLPDGWIRESHTWDACSPGKRRKR